MDDGGLTISSYCLKLGACKERWPGFGKGRCATSGTSSSRILKKANQLTRGRDGAFMSRQTQETLVVYRCPVLLPAFDTMGKTSDP